jgi:hypothetical protein
MVPGHDRWMGGEEGLGWWSASKAVAFDTGAQEPKRDFFIFPSLYTARTERRIPFGHNPGAKPHEVLRLLNRIKPIERLVPVD